MEWLRAGSERLQTSSRANESRLLFLAPARLPIGSAKLKLGLEPSRSQHYMPHTFSSSLVYGMKSPSPLLTGLAQDELQTDCMVY